LFLRVSQARWTMMGNSVGNAIGVLSQETTARALPLALSARLATLPGWPL
jgi:hypothetical protein